MNPRHRLNLLAVRYKLPSVFRQVMSVENLLSDVFRQVLSVKSFPPAEFVKNLREVFSSSHFVTAWTVGSSEA